MSLLMTVGESLKRQLLVWSSITTYRVMRLSIMLGFCAGSTMEVWMVGGVLEPPHQPWPNFIPRKGNKITKIVDTTTSEITPSSSRLETDEILEMFENPSGPVGHNLTGPSLSGEPSNPSRQAGDENIVQIIVRPVGRGRYAAFLEGHLLCKRETPLLSSARVLKAEGVRDDTSLEMIHEGSTVVALRSTVGSAAGLRVSETGGTPRFVPWKPDKLPGNRPAACTVQRLHGKTALPECPVAKAHPDRPQAALPPSPRPLTTKMPLAGGIQREGAMRRAINCAL
jgi:hypothetical protein